MSDSTIQALEAEADEIRARIAPKEQEIQEDREQLRRLDIALSALRGEQPPVQINRGNVQERARRQGQRGATKDAILDYLRDHPNSSAGDVADGLGAESKGSIATRLQKMSSDGVILKTGAGDGRRVVFRLHS
jgi:chromosome segregation ATPase